ncbi:aspartate aminotransferase family protein [Thalassococcus sp. S3]|uniref:pyridoxal phosphate-dependent decarboxylase family protein n=1 Tax=Thalassococcus sp. S3 TaxID=2017482 RepID=UPI0013EE6C34|nr:aspartate aminotransferase family protein [Thalassococcus sp. S3]
MQPRTILDNPVPTQNVIAELQELSGNDVSAKETAIVSGLYDPGAEINDLAKSAYGMFLSQNALYFNLYPSVARMEQDLVGAALTLLRGDGSSCGNITSGGTESIMLAVKSARDTARQTRPEVTKPRIVLPITAHPAFHKAAHYLGIETVVTKVDPTGFRADLSDFEAALDDQTILAVGSAPNYSHGTVDPISEMSELARSKGILFHVDGCVGGLYLSYMRRLGLRDKPFDFSLPGVTSISVDLHKYGYAPKNASLVLYRNRALRQAAWFINSSTTEYAVINPTVQSSRTSGPIAAAWAVMRHLGHTGYEAMVERCQATTTKVLKEVGQVRDVDVLADPEMCIFTLASDTLNIFEIDDAMRQLGWMLTPQFACGGGPENVHVSVHDGVLDRMTRFAPDLERSAAQLKQNGSAVDEVKIRQTLASLAGQPIEQMLGTLMPMAGLTGPNLPEQLAPMNTILNHLPAEMRDAALGLYLSATR